MGLSKKQYVSLTVISVIITLLFGTGIALCMDRLFDKIYGGFLLGALSGVLFFGVGVLWLLHYNDISNREQRIEERNSIDLEDAYRRGQEAMLAAREEEDVKRELEYLKYFYSQENVPGEPIGWVD